MPYHFQCSHLSLYQQQQLHFFATHNSKSCKQTQETKLEKDKQNKPLCTPYVAITSLQFLNQQEVSQEHPNHTHEDGTKQRCEMDASHKKHFTQTRRTGERERRKSPSPLKLPHQADGRFILQRKGSLKVLMERQWTGSLEQRTSYRKNYLLSDYAIFNGYVAKAECVCSTNVIHRGQMEAGYLKVV